jgi:transcription initiation factor TFIID subunit 5
MTASVYSTDRTAPLRLFTGHTSDVTAVCWHENATLIATSADDKTARLWDLRSGKCVRLFSGSPSPLSCVAMSSVATTVGAASLLAGGTDAGSVCVWDVGTGRHIAVMQGHSDSINSVSFNSDGTALASGGADCSIRIFDVNLAISARSSFIGPSATNAACPSSSSRLSAYSSVSKYGPAGVPAVCQPKHTYHTKFSPVFFLEYTDKNLLFSGGPFSLYCATTRGVQGGQDAAEENISGGPDRAPKQEAQKNTISNTATEQETAAALGLSQSVISC